MAESHIEKKGKRDGQRPRKNNKAEGLSKKKERERKAKSAYVCQKHKSEKKKKMKEAQSA